MRDMVHDTKIQVRFPKKLKARIRREAARRFVTDSVIFREALQHYFERKDSQPVKEAA